jgi:uncharacterized membrane protein YgcG
MNHRFLHFQALMACVVLLWSISSQAETLNARDPYINDYAHVLDQNLESNLRDRLEFHAHNRGIQIMVLTLDNYEYQSNGNKSLMEYGESIFNSWRENGKINNSGLLVIADRNSNQINIIVGDFYPSYYRDLATDIIENKVEGSTETATFSNQIKDSTEALVDATVTEIGFIQWHKWQLLTALYLLFSIFIAYVIRNNQNAPLPLLLLGIFGVFVMVIVNGIFGSVTNKQVNNRV